MKQPVNLASGSIYVSTFRNELLNMRYVNWLNDPEVVKYSEQRHAMHTLSSCQKYVNAMSKSGNLFLSIELVDLHPAHIGNISVVFDWPNSSADLAILVGEKCVWGMGYASLAWNLVIDFLLNEIELRRVTAGTMEINEPMIRLIKKSGMTIDHLRPRYFLWEGQEVGLIGASKYKK